ncbi:MAG: hypothetical protein JO214_10830 [Frankiaceae bacterium]|nr:hypothetical protein [Frankiaceae bacterium]
MNRISRLITLTAVAFASLTATASSAFASVPPAPAGERAASLSPSVVSHASSGLAVWVVALIAAGSVLVGIALATSVRSIRHRGTHGLATA